MSTDQLNPDPHGLTVGYIALIVAGVPPSIIHEQVSLHLAEVRKLPETLN